MINLLPPEAKAEIRAGRANRLLVRYLFLFIALMMLLFAEIGVAFYFLTQTKVQADKTVEQTKNKSSQLSDEQAKVTQFTKDLATAKQILDKQTNYSTIILRVASIIPSGVVIDQLNLDSSTFGKPTTITAHAKNDTAALALKTAMSNSHYFANPHFSTLTTNPAAIYPITINMDVTFTQELLK